MSYTISLCFLFLILEVINVVLFLFRSDYHHHSMSSGSGAIFRMSCPFVIALCCKEKMHSDNNFIPSLLNYVMQALEGGAFGMWIALIDR